MTTIIKFERSTMTKSICHLATYHADFDEDTVSYANACPDCGENRMDKLVWDENEVVICQTCGAGYLPNQEAN